MMILMLIQITLASTMDRVYVQQPFTHIHHSASRFSMILTTFECNHPLTIDTKKSSSEWLHALYGEFEGFVMAEHVGDQRNENCLQYKYPKFFEVLNLGIGDMHKWARLLDLFDEGESLPSGVKK